MPGIRHSSLFRSLSYSRQKNTRKNGQCNQSEEFNKFRQVGKFQYLNGKSRKQTQQQIRLQKAWGSRGRRPKETFTAALFFSFLLFAYRHIS